METVFVRHGGFYQEAMKEFLKGHPEFIGKNRNLQFVKDAEGNILSARGNIGGAYFNYSA